MTARAALAISLTLLLAAGCGGTAESLPRGDPGLGEAIVEDLSPTCGQCHVLESAGFEGEGAPDLDVLRPGYQRVLDAIREGPGFMPSYARVLDDDELHHVAAFISRETTQ